MRDHEYYQALMSRLLDEGLTAKEERELKEHVRSCSECAKLFSVFSAVTVSLREDMAEPPAALSRGVMDRIAADKEERPRVIHVQRPSLWWFVAAAVVGLAPAVLDRTLWYAYLLNGALAPGSENA